jgi:hypothetical protein
MRRLHALHAAQQRRPAPALAASLGALLGTQLRRLARTDAAVAELARGAQQLVHDAGLVCSAACSSSTAPDASAVAAQHRRLLARFEAACAAAPSTSSAASSPLLPRALRRLLSRPEHAADALPLLLAPHAVGQLLRVLARAAGAAAAGRFAERRLLRLVAAQQQGAQKADIEQAVLELLDALHALALSVPSREGGSADMDMTAALELALLGVLREAPPELAALASSPRRPTGSSNGGSRHVSAPLSPRPPQTRPRRGSSPSQPGSPRTAAAQWQDTAAEVWAGLGKGVESIASLTGSMSGFFSASTAPKSPNAPTAVDAAPSEKKPTGAPASLSLSRFISPASTSLATPPASPMAKRTVSGSTLAALSEDSADAHATFVARPGDAVEALAAVGGEERAREIRVSEILPPSQAAPDVKEVLHALAGNGTGGMPLIKWLLWRMLHVHFPPTDATTHRPLLLLLLVRWYAFTHLRRLICTPPQQSATPAPTLSLARDADDDQTPTQAKTARFFEGTWLQGGRELRALGETHRAVYGDVVRALGLGNGEASPEAQRLVATFAQGAELVDEPAQGVCVLPMQSAEAAELLLFLEPLLTASPAPQSNGIGLHLGSSPVPNGTSEVADAQVKLPKLHIDTSPDPGAGSHAVTHEHVAAAAQALRDVGEEHVAVLYVGAKAKDKIVVSWTLEALDEQLSAARAQVAMQAATVDSAAPSQPSSSLASAGATFPPSAAGATLPQSHTSSSISTIARGASGDSGWGSPPHTPDERDEFLFEPATPSAAPAALPMPVSASLEARRSGSETASPPTRRPSRRSANAPSSWRAALGSESFSLAPPPRPAREPELGEELFDEVRRGLLGVLRKGYCSDASRLPLLVLRDAERIATQSHAFDDAALFARTTALLQHIAAAFPSLRGSAASEEATFAPLLDRIAAPLRTADAAAEQAVQIATLRLREVELHRVALMERAREAYATAHEARTRVWYASEIRTAPAFRDSLKLARSHLHAGDEAPQDESGEDWMQRLGVYDFGLPPPLQGYMRDLDGAFGVIAGDAAAFFAHDLFAREASLALPYLRGAGPGAEEQDKTAVLTFGACPPSLLLPGEIKAAARVALDEFLQRTQLLATGFFLSEALSHLSVVAMTTASAVPSGVSQAILAELRTAGAPELLRRFELHPAPRAKMRALLVLERLIVALLSRSADAAATGTRPRAASIVSLAKVRHRRAQSNARDSPPLSAVSSTRPLSLRSPARARRALSMYDDEDDEEAGSADSPLEGKGIHALLERLLKGNGGTEPAASTPAEAEQPAPQRLRQTSAPTTDDVVGVLEGLLADATCRPRDLFLHLQVRHGIGSCEDSAEHER